MKGNQRSGASEWLQLHGFKQKVHMTYLSLSSPMQNAKDPCHDVAWQKKSSSPKKKKLRKIEREFSL
jgi:hypothetical protein